MKQIINYIRRDEWSPYIAGVLLGIVGILAVWLSNSLLGASGAFENIAGLIGKTVAPKLFDNMYFNFIMPPPRHHMGRGTACRCFLRRHDWCGHQRHPQMGQKRCS